MQDDAGGVVGNSSEEAGPGDPAAPGAGAEGDARSVQACAAVPPGASPGTAAARGRRRRRAAVTAFAAVAVLAGFGIGAVSQAALAPGTAVPSSAIPAPPRSNATFVEDDNLTAQDNQGNILQSSAPGLVRISRGGNVVGSGFVLTPSGKVLTSDQILRGAGKLTARLVLSGVTFGARVIGTDPAGDLALLQMQSSNGGAFPTVKLGNSADIVASTSRSQQFSWHMPGEVLVTALGTSGAHDGAILDVGNLIGLNATASAGGRRLSGLLRSTAQVLPGQETGGPLVDLSGEVIGLDVTGTGSGLHSAGYAIPINDALTMARRIQASGRAK